MREYVKVPLLHAHARMSMLEYLANAMPMDTTDRTMPMPARHQSRLASAMMSLPFYSFINEYITISIAFPSLTALLRRIPSIMKPFFSKNIIKYNNCYIFFRIFVSIRLRTTCIFDSKLEATCSSWPKLGQVDPSWSVLPTCLAGVHGELHGCSRSRVSGAGHPPSIHVD